MKSTMTSLLPLAVLFLLTACSEPENSAPRIVSVTSSPEQIQILETCLLTVVATDDNGDKLDYSWYSESGALEPINGTNTAVWRSPGNPDRYTIEVSVNDGRDIASDRVDIEVVGGPTAPLCPHPLDGSVKVPQTLVLSWSNCDDSVSSFITYDILLGTTTYNLEIIQAGYCERSLPIDRLSTDTEYFWQVVAYDEFDNYTTSDIWSFRTEMGPGSASDPVPYTGRYVYPDDVMLSWEYEDPEADEYVFDLLLSTSTTASEFFAEGLTTNSIQIDSLAADDTYYWKIITRDSKGNTTEGPRWYFYTLGRPEEHIGPSLSSKAIWKLNEEAITANIALSPDGSLLAIPIGNDVEFYRTTGSLGATYLWAAGRLEGHSSPVACVSFSPDGSLLFSGDNSGLIMAWDVENESVIDTLEGHSSGITDITVSDDGSLLLSCSSDETARVWQIGFFNEMAVYHYFSRDFTAVDFSPNGLQFASAHEDKCIRIWDINSLTPDFTLLDLDYEPSTVKFSPDGTLLLCGTLGGNILAYETSSWKLRFSNRIARAAISDIVIHPYRSLFLTAGESHSYSNSDIESVTLRSLLTGDLIHEASVHSSYARATEFDASGTYFYSVGNSNDGSYEYVSKWTVLDE